VNGAAYISIENKRKLKFIGKSGELSSSIKQKQRWLGTKSKRM